MAEAPRIFDRALLRRRRLRALRGEPVDFLLKHVAVELIEVARARAAIDEIAAPSRRLDRMCEINVEMQVRRVAATPIVENAWASGQSLHLHGWIYAMHDGLLRDLGPHLSSIEERDALPSIDLCVRERSEPQSGLRRHAYDAFAGCTGHDKA